MPILSRIGRRSWKTRLLVGTMYALLAVGAVAMVYPFLLMLAGSTKSAVDARASRIVPAFVVDTPALYAKYVEGLFNESLDLLRYTYDGSLTRFRGLAPPSEPNRALAAAWLDFLEAEAPPPQMYAVGFMHTPASLGVLPHNLRAFKRDMLEQYRGDLDAFNRDMGTHFPNWNAFLVPPGHYLVRRSQQDESGLQQALRGFKQGADRAERYYFSIEGFYRAGFLMAQYTRSIEVYNDAHETSYRSWADIRLDRAVPTAHLRTAREREDWLTFVRQVLNLRWVRVAPEAVAAYRAFLAARHGTPETLNDRYGTAYAAFEDVMLPDPEALGGLAAGDWDLFLQGWEDPSSGTVHRVPDEMLLIDSPDYRFQDYLETRFGSVAVMNEALGTRATSFAAVRPPQRDLHYLAFLDQQGRLKWEFLRRNYVSVADYILLHGRGVVNTVVYCGLAILCALLVNPLAAYALSRYRPPSTYRILLLLMLTMAFPPMVTQIPLFLMLRDLHLLNTFWALVLPGLAHGYAIFLLKGFFDSLPRELYESAAIDGAGEFRIFRQITMSLSKPILAVVALNAFTVAYSNFMMALLLCQDERMWTLMPWLYQLQQRSGAGVVSASLVIAAIPTFLVFAFCQNIIMRGIVVPVEK